MADVGSVITSAVVGVVSYAGAIFNNALNYRTKVDEGLRDARIKLYKILWQKTDILPKWPRRTDVTYEMIETFSRDLRSWYFNEGGLYLSARARRAYGDLQDAIGEVFSRNSAGPIKDPDYDRLRDRCSALRTQLTGDLLSRRTAPHWIVAP